MISLSWNCSSVATAIHWARSITLCGDAKNALDRAIKSDHHRSEFIQRSRTLSDSVVGQFAGDSRFGWRLLLASQLSRNKSSTADKNDSIDSLLSFIQDLEESLRQACPTLDYQLPLRIRPLQEQWLGYGPGLVRSMVASLGVKKYAPRVEVVAVQPLLNGFGESFSDHNALIFEAVLTNPHDKLPEVVRLAWLVAESALGIRTDSHSEMRQRLIAATINAAVEMELIQPSNEIVSIAQKYWNPDWLSA